MSTLKVGDTVVFLMPAEEQNEILSFVGRTATIAAIDEFGYFWIGFGTQMDDGDEARYSGHSFAVTKDCLQGR